MGLLGNSVGFCLNFSVAQTLRSYTKLGAIICAVSLFNEPPKCPYEWMGWCQCHEQTATCMRTFYFMFALVTAINQSITWKSNANIINISCVRSMDLVRCILAERCKHSVVIGSAWKLASSSKRHNHSSSKRLTNVKLARALFITSLFTFCVTDVENWFISYFAYTYRIRSIVVWFVSSSK